MEKTRIKLKIKINNNWDIINSKDLEKNNVLHSIRLNLSKKYKMSMIDWLSHLDYDFKIEKCGICNTRLSHVEPVFYINDMNEIIITGVIYPLKYYCKQQECKNKYNPNSIEYVSRTNKISKEEAISIIHSRNSSPFYIENHGSKDEYLKYQTRDDSWVVNTYGVDYLNEYHKKLKHSHTLEYNISKYGEELGREIFNKKCASKDSMSFNFALKKFNGNIEKANVYRLYRIEQTRPITNSFYSKESIRFFDKLIEVLNITNNYLYKENELRLKNNGNYFYYDFTLINKKKIIEYNGTTFHVNVDKLTKEELIKWKQPFTNESWENVYKYDMIKKEVATKNGYDVLYIWSDDDFDVNLEKCVNFLK